MYARCIIFRLRSSAASARYAFRQNTKIRRYPTITVLVSSTSAPIHGQSGLPASFTRQWVRGMYVPPLVKKSSGVPVSHDAVSPAAPPPC